MQEFKRGDDVIIKSDKNLVKELQEGHGGWNEAMISILGRTGKVLEVDGSGDLVVSVEGDKWMMNPAAVTYVTEPEPGQSPGSDDASGEDPLGLFGLFRDLFLHRAMQQGRLSLVNAAKTNQLSRVREILDAQPEAIDELEDGHTALHTACHQGHCDVIRELLDRGASRNTLDLQGYTAIHHSTYADQSGEALKLLLEKGFNPNVQHGNNGSTALHLAVKRDNEMAVRILTQCPECDVNLQDEAGDTPLHDAISARKHSMVDMLLDNPRLSLTVSNQRGFNYLQHAILKGNKQAVEKLLVKAGDVLNVTKSDGFTTLHIAAINDHREIAKLLLKQPGCEVDALTTDNTSVLHLAANKGYSAMVEILLDHGAHVNVVDNDGDTPLHIALAKESFLQTDMTSEMPALQLLLGVHGDSRTYAAVSRCLLSYGADVRKLNEKGESPLDRCRGSEVEHLIREIAAFGGKSQNRKVPSFGDTKQPQDKEELNGVPTSATEEEGTHNVVEGHGTSASEAGDGQEDVNKVSDDIRNQNQPGQLANDLENQEETEEQGNEEVSGDENLVDNSMETDTSYQKRDFKRGDEVIIKSDKNLVKELQEGHGGWNESMISILGRTGKVLKVDGSGDLVVLVEGDKWMLNPAAVTYVTEPEPGESSDSSDASSEDPLGLFGLFRDILLRRGNQQGSLSLAAKTNQLSRVREILDAHPELINEIEDGHTALHIACHEGHCDVIRELLDRGANTNIRDLQGYTAMHHSTYGDRSGEALKLLLEKGFNPNVQHGNNGRTPLHLAVKKDNEMAIRILTQCPECDVNLQDNDGDTPLHDAILGEKHSMVDMLLDNPRLSLTVSNQRGFNYLQHAILRGNLRTVEKLLVKAGDVLNVTKSDGFTTLHIAAINDHREIAKLLLKQPGCEVDALTTNNQSGLHLAANEGYPTMVEILLDHGAHVNVVDNDGDTPLHIALAKESFLRTDEMSEMPALQMLLRVHGESRTYAAVSRCLLNYGADVRKMNEKGETPLDRCRGSEVEHLIREIAAFGGKSQHRKVPSFGGTKQSQDREELNGVSSSATEEEGAQKVVEGHGTGTSEADDNLEDVSESCDNNSDQDQPGQVSGELENQGETGEQENVDVLGDENLVENSMETVTSYQENIVLEVTNQVQEELPDTEFSNNSTITSAEMTVNNADSANGDSECAVLEARSEGNEEYKDKETEHVEEENPPACDEQKPKCQICEENEAVVAFKPCGHTAVCIECAPRLKRCLECKTAITGKGTRDGSPIIEINNKSLVARYQKLEGKLRKLEESIQCCICVERKKNIIFLCGHGTCHSCAEQLKVCHICQKPIEMKISIF
ncbi:uncharacterized protein LOC144666947 isoform X2 [Oculina patagonica]